MSKPQTRRWAGNPIFVGVGLLSLLLVGILSATGCGYGKVSERSYKFATALYGVCLSKSEVRLEKLSDLLDEDDVSGAPIPSHERAWLESIIKQAQDGDWETAAASSKRMMKDQVEY